MGETYYDVLEIDPNATQDEIRSAYRDRVLEAHPDHNDAPDAADQFRRVSRAESILTDGTERARYDRLGHESYVRLAQHSAVDASEETSDGRATSTGAERATARTTDRSQGRTTARSQHTTEQSRDRATSRTRRATDRSRRDRSWRTDADSTTGRTRSHHARQRSQRHRQTSKRATSGSPFDTDRSRSSTSGAQSRQQPSTAEKKAESESGFSYAVHNWEGEIELDPDGHQLDQPTIVSLGAVTVLYPLLVYASLTPAFSLLTNAIVAACTLALVGYMLTSPRIAIVSFGGWSILLPLFFYAAPIDPGSLYSLLAIAFCWIPFGFAIGVWWVLRP